MLLETVLTIPSVLGILVIAGFAILRARQPAYMYFGALAFLFAIFLTAQYFLDVEQGNPHLWLEIASISASFSAAAFVPFIYAYPNHKALSSKRLLALLLLPLVFSLLSPTSLSIKYATFTSDGLVFQPGPSYLLQSFVLLGYFVLGFCVLAWRLHKVRRTERTQLYLIILAFSIALVGVTLSGVVFVDSLSWQTARPISMLGMVVVIAYGMISHQLFDIHFFVVRAAAYLSTLFAITLIFVAPFVLGITYMLGGTLSPGQFWIVVIASVGLLYLMQAMKSVFDRITARLFFRHDYDPQDVQDKLGNILVRTADLNQLIENTGAVLRQALRPTDMGILLFTDQVKKSTQLAAKIDEYSTRHRVDTILVDDMRSDDPLAHALKKQGIALAVKLRTTHEDIGYVVLGHKQSGGLYSERDLRLLGAAADEIAIGLQNALRFEEIQRFNLTLQEEVDNKTRKLQRTNKRLEELDNIKDDFISMASHQLRTPLTSVKGYLSMVLEGDAGKLNSTQTQMLKQAFTSSQRMVFLITDLLNVSRLKTGKFVIDRAPLNLANLIEDELDQLHETAQVKNIELSFNRPKSFPDLMLDEVKTRQVIMNFLDNAIYYTPAGGHIRVELVDKPASVELRVVDDGIGVPKEEQHHLFTKFYRATNARKARPDGTGLGLFMAQKVIVAQGGTIIFSSKENRGSTFGFAFSKSRLAVPRRAVKAPAASAPVAEPPSVKTS